eukprot:TRINITY_DN7830_c0_g1_i2.p1 TRINITY_DN7830_c0_g1~~TRINITY_DN7830_c0_g1_i2.p1  ORF type:complete len:216 (+),score=27.08 TRINITY_DN7830_c0_g1_i2:53-700(+)
MPRAVAHGHAGVTGFGYDAAVSSVMWALSDGVCQGIEMKTGAFAEKEQQVYDWQRTGRFALVAIPAGIWLHAWFKLLDYWFPKRTFGTLVLMAAVDWIGEMPYIFANMSMNAFLSGGYTQVKKTIQSDFMDCNMWNLTFWFPMDIIMFACVPVGWQLLFVRSLDLIFLPVDSFFSNRSVPKPHAITEAADDEDPDDEDDFTPQKPRDNTLCCTIL